MILYILSVATGETVVLLGALLISKYYVNRNSLWDEIGSFLYWFFFTFFIQYGTYLKIEHSYIN